VNIVISGHFGGINLGDDAILCSLIDSLRKIYGDDLSLTVFSHDPKLTYKQTAATSVKQISFTPSMVKDLHAMIKAIRLSDFVIIGGGGLLQDEFNIKTIPRYLLPAIIGKFYGKKVIFYSLGVGPINTRYSKDLIRLLSAQVDHITVRDKESKEIMEGLGVREVDIVPDPAIHLSKCDKSKIHRILMKEKIDSNRVPKIGVSLRGIYHTKRRKIRSMKSLSVEQKAIIAESLEELANNLKGLLVFFCTDNSMDKKISKEIAGRCNCDSRLIIAKYSPTEFAGLLGVMDVVISMPLHSAIIATSSYIPVVAMEYNPKVRNFMRFIGLGEYVLPIERLDLLEARTMEIWLERAAIHDHLKKEIGRLQERFTAHLQRMLSNRHERRNPRNIPLLIFSLIYMGSAFIPEYLIHKYLMK
jgi:polysaccharide pyruvyl transferase CsaB